MGRNIRSGNCRSNGEKINESKELKQKFNTSWTMRIINLGYMKNNLKYKAPSHVGRVMEKRI